VRPESEELMPTSKKRKRGPQAGEQIRRELRFYRELAERLAAGLLDAKQTLLVAAGALRTMDQGETADLLVNKALAIAAAVPSGTVARALPHPGVEIVNVKPAAEPRIELVVDGRAVADVISAHVQGVRDPGRGIL
jgi:hypothetical protein